MNASAVLPTPATFQVEIAVAGLLFDMDGVLVQSTEGDERCWTRWAARHGFAATFELHRTHGRRAADTIREYCPKLDVRGLTDHLAQLDSFAAEELQGVVAYPGVVACWLRSHLTDGLL
jgi:sugar-phosphatase